VEEREQNFPKKVGLQRLQRGLGRGSCWRWSNNSHTVQIMYHAFTLQNATNILSEAAPE
jgi:hypothetical protein